MNRYQRKLRTDFGPEVRFTVSPVPFREREQTAFEQLNQRLLKERLEATADAEEIVVLRRAANDAAALAWTTPYPLLVFPVLLDETAQRAFRQKEKQEAIRQRSRELVLALA